MITYRPSERAYYATLVARVGINKRINNANNFRSRGCLKLHVIAQRAPYIDQHCNNRRQCNSWLSDKRRACVIIR